MMPYTVTVTRGSMTFKSGMAAWEFRTLIATWPRFTRPPITREEAVDYHLAYEKGGEEAVLALERSIIEREQAEEMQLALGLMIQETERRMRYAKASMADPRSYEYKSHFDSWHPDYRYGT